MKTPLPSQEELKAFESYAKRIKLKHLLSFPEKDIENKMKINNERKAGSTDN